MNVFFWSRESGIGNFCESLTPGFGKGWLGIENRVRNRGPTEQEFGNQGTYRIPSLIGNTQ